MDTLSSAGLTREQIEQMVLAQEKKYPTLRWENEKIRAWASRNPEWLKAHPWIDVDAALLSDCRSDRLNCGRCAFRYAVGMAWLD